MNDIIKLSVGGREFKTSRGTLMADQYSMLSKMTLQYREYGYPPLVKVENDRGEDNQAVHAGGRRAKDDPQHLRHGFENAVYKIMSTMAYRSFTKLCRR